MAGEPDEAVRERDPVAELVVQPLGLAPGLDRGTEAVRVVELLAVVVEQRRPLARLEPAGVRDHGLEVRERLAVRSGARRFARRRRTLFEQRVDVARLGRVVQEPGAVGSRPRAQRPHDLLVEQPPPDPGQALLDRPPRELVSEPDPAGPRLDQPRQLGFGERLELPAEQRARQLDGTEEGTTDRRSSASRHSGPTWRSRASTASLTLAGTSSGGAASASATKNGLPRVNA
jgi:hypothetical protein